MAIIVSCPTCKKEVPFSADNPFRPFCSERCRMVDLGTWLEEGFSIPGANDPDIIDAEQA